MLTEVSPKAGRNNEAVWERTQAARWDFDVAYRIRTPTDQQYGSIWQNSNDDEDPNGKEEAGSRDEDETSEPKSHEKRQFRWQSSRKSHVSGRRTKRKTPRSTQGELMRLMPTPRSSLGPGADRPSALLPCDLPDAFLQEQLHNSQWRDEIVRISSGHTDY